MSRRIAPLMLPLVALALVAARKPDDPKHENHYQTDGAIPTATGVTLALTGAQSQQQFVAVDTKVTNSSSDQVLVVKKGEATFVLPTGSFTTKGGGILGGPMFIPPGETRSLGMKVTGDSGFHVDSFALKLGGLSLGSTTGTPVKAPDFALPASANDFTAGPFACHLDGLKKETDETTAKFACTYNGTGLGIVDPRKVGVKTESGQEYASDARKAARDLVLPGDTSKFSVVFHVTEVDMQFAKLTVLFRDAFAETPLTPVALADWKFVVDPAATAAANK